MKKWKLLFAAQLFLFGCNYNQSKNTGDTGAQIQKIVPPEQITFKMLQTSVLPECLRCHSAAGGNKGGISLETFADVFKNAHQIRIEVAGGTMPPTGKLSDAKIKMLTDWIDNGALENGGKPSEPPPAPVPTPAPEPTPTPVPTPVPVPVPAEIKFEDVLTKVIKTSCLKCHSGFEIYENVFSKKELIKSEVTSGSMPQDSTLTDEQKKLILNWIEQGAPK